MHAITGSKWAKDFVKCMKELAFNGVTPPGRALYNGNEVISIDIHVGMRFAKVMWAEWLVSAWGLGELGGSQGCGQGHVGWWHRGRNRCF